ncbi:hypothetical protein QQF64_013593 [Cirrhinus molitorella]|uniref:Endonuclease/exonuclease/phosphatase domain-containing protein n=1 Tax=Cirrhinus molitorella TaxID=172907 RepID=A0ABR3LRK7_9TELE
MCVCVATFISVYAPTLEAEHNIKEDFYGALDAILQKTPASDRLILMGDFNARVGAEHLVWSKVIGQHGAGKMNHNGLRLLSLCAEHQLVITNTIFQMKNGYKTTWLHPHSKHWHLLDYVIIRQKDRQDVRTTVLCEELSAGLTTICHITKDNLQRLLDEKLNKIPEEPADWPALHQATYDAALEAFGQERKHHQGLVRL